ncbi:hypothetical protein J6590_040017 [Homalodisca vitripennis]|nr:hypothetical protein J6590_040017 [Homalodisca vitripennis]
MSTKDAERSGRPVEVTSPLVVVNIHDMVKDDRRLKVPPPVGRLPDGFSVGCRTHTDFVTNDVKSDARLPHIRTQSTVSSRCYLIVNRIKLQGYGRHVNGLYFVSRTTSNIFNFPYQNGQMCCRNQGTSEGIIQSEGKWQLRGTEQ